MIYGVNRVTLVGNVGDEPRVSEKEGEAIVANITLATNGVWRDKPGEEVRRTEWHRIVCMSGIFNSTGFLRKMLNGVHSNLSFL
jgi:single-strand DNA-binding protein